MDKLLPTLPKDPIAEYSNATTCTPDDIIESEKMMGSNNNAITTAEQRGPFCSPAPPPFPFSLSYSSKSDSSGEKKVSGKKSRRNKKGGGGNKKRMASRSKMADARTPPSASSASSSEHPRTNAARHPGQPSSANNMQRDGKFQSPAEDPMFAALFASHGDESRLTATSAPRSYSSPNVPKAPGDLQVGKVVTEEETSPPSDGASKPDSLLQRYESHAETPSRGVNLGSSPYHHLSPGHPYYQFPPPAQYFQPTGHGVSDAYHYHQGYQGYDPYFSYAEHPPVDGHGTIYDGYYPYNTEYYAGPYPGLGDEHVGNHEEAFYQQLPGITERSPGKVSHSSTQSHSPGGTSRHAQTPKKRQASSASVGNDSPYEAPMPQLSSATPISAGSPPPVKKQRILSSAWADRFSELLEYKKANGKFATSLSVAWPPLFSILLELLSHSFQIQSFFCFSVYMQLFNSYQGTAMSLRSILIIQPSAFGSTSSGWNTSFTRRVRKRQ